jgi:carbon monoxide dehydrogenase subunit G
VRVSGSRTIRAPAVAIWGFLMSPEQLRGCLPGCERFAPCGPDQFEAQLRLGVGFVKGTYRGTVLVAEQQPHTVLGLAVEGSGALGSLAAKGTVRFAEAGGATHLAYDGEAFVGGSVAALGERVVSTTTSRLISRFFDCVASKVEKP